MNSPRRGHRILATVLLLTLPPLKPPHFPSEPPLLSLNGSMYEPHSRNAGDEAMACLSWQIKGWSPAFFLLPIRVMDTFLPSEAPVSIISHSICVDLWVLTRRGASAFVCHCVFPTSDPEGSLESPSAGMQRRLSQNNILVLFLCWKTHTVKHCLRPFFVG